MTSGVPNFHMLFHTMYGGGYLLIIHLMLSIRLSTPADHQVGFTVHEDIVGLPYTQPTTMHSKKPMMSSDQVAAK